MGPSSLGTPSLHGWMEESPLRSELGPSTQDPKGKMNLNSTNSGGPGTWWAGSL